ncbi:GtrA family protein [Allokutzneria sp. A3M-2-11 16]|uniref:GtrA family protein n=1 Tax=Allokutzneria sp. A3M-2-11 16 TaxID=2962043 RepID=UPI0020B6AE2A|nr:GtrA family protein [Allokutzneria sp. A3M-2-11 16]MCP3799681.1 GtrA family protein [Allokutzneria sp. A3M-2-11 16]
MNFGKYDRIVRFAVVGAINTGVYYGLYLLLGQVAHYQVAHITAFLIAMVGSYFLSCYFTFKVRPTLRKFLLFPLSNATSFIVQTAGLYLLVDVIGMHEDHAPLITMAVSIPITYLVAKFVLTDRPAAASALAAAPQENPR